jgi:hypothetical protein
MSTLFSIEFTHPDILSVYPSVLALIESTKNDTVPFDAKIIMKLLINSKLKPLEFLRNI